MLKAEQVIAALDLKPLSLEGGFFRETYRCEQHHAAPQGERNLCTAIYFLLTADKFSALHRLPHDEIFHFYMGNPVKMLQLWPDGMGRVVKLGHDLSAGQSPQIIVPAGVWQGSWVVPGGSFALLGTTIAPGFDFADFEAGERAALIKQYPTFGDMIRRLTV